jgi:histidine triad (HIT) family protein
MVGCGAEHHDLPMSRQDWYCDEVIPGRSKVRSWLMDPRSWRFGPTDQGRHRKHHRRAESAHPSRLDLRAELAGELLQVVQQMASCVSTEVGGCQIVVSVGSEQHNEHLHVHIAAGDGVARFVS